MELVVFLDGECEEVRLFFSIVEVVEVFGKGIVFWFLCFGVTFANGFVFLLHFGLREPVEISSEIDEVFVIIGHRTDLGQSVLLRAGNVVACLISQPQTDFKIVDKDLLGRLNCFNAYIEHQLVRLFFVIEIKFSEGVIEVAAVAELEGVDIVVVRIGQDGESRKLDEDAVVFVFSTNNEIAPLILKGVKRSSFKLVQYV